ncbi:MAG: CRTAC1 family protein [Planctomycetes bacterium]|nr:CRTAC1 family protein [Planctomycetota bacterium]
MNRISLVFFCLSCFVFAPADGFSAPPFLFRDVTEQTGIDFRHTHGETGNLYIVEYICSGLALFDYDGDGLVDIYFLNGASLPGSDFETTPTNALYRNKGGFRFRDVTHAAGLGDVGHGLGVAVADYDNDGDQDVYISNFGPNAFYENNGDGTFTRAPAAPLLADGHRVGAGVCFLDIEQDGDLDLYSANYVKFSYEDHVPRSFLGLPTAPSPKDYDHDADSLFRNNGDSTFSNVSVESGIGRHPGPGMGAVCMDVDGDGDADIVTCNDTFANFCFENDGTGRFQEGAVLRGLAYDFAGLQQGSMGIDCGDCDNDGLLDLVMTSYQDQMPALYRNLDGGFFEDISPIAGLRSVYRQVNWGVTLADFDNDRDRDIFMVNGHLDDNIGDQDDSLNYAQQNSLFMNDGRGRFTDVSGRSGDGLLLKRVGRGAGFDDLDNDGDMDAVVLNACQQPTVLRNDSPRTGNWLQVRCIGRGANRDGVGALVKVTAGGTTQSATIHSGRGYQSDYGRRLHFGLGAAEVADRVEITWPGGPTDFVETVPMNQVLNLTQGR